MVIPPRDPGVLEVAVRILAFQTLSDNIIYSTIPLAHITDIINPLGAFSRFWGCAVGAEILFDPESGFAIVVDAGMKI